MPWRRVYVSVVLFTLLTLFLLYQFSQHYAG